MKTATIKDTKQIIFEAYEEAVTALKAANTSKFDPSAVKAAKVKVETVEKAEAIVEMNILNGEIVDKYNSLKEAITMKESELKEYYGIEKGIESILALIEAKKVIEETMEADYVSKELALKEKEANMRITYTKAAEELGVERTRKMEEYAYDLKRSRQMENDRWEDLKLARLNELKAKESEYDIEVADLEAREVAMNILEAKVAEIPTLIAQAATDATAKAKSDADKAHAIEKNVIKRETELDKTLLANKVDNLQETVIRLQKENESLMSKLESAQERVETIATTAVNAAQPRVFANEK